MTKLAPKRVSDSMTSQVQIIMPEHINGYHRLFGGQLVEWIDVVAGVVARRHSNRNVTTAFIDHLHFKAPAYATIPLSLRGESPMWAALRWRCGWTPLWKASTASASLSTAPISSPLRSMMMRSRLRCRSLSWKRLRMRRSGRRAAP